MEDVIQNAAVAALAEAIAEAHGYEVELRDEDGFYYNLLSIRPLPDCPEHVVEVATLYHDETDLLIHWNERHPAWALPDQPRHDQPFTMLAFSLELEDPASVEKAMWATHPDSLEALQGADIAMHFVELELKDTQGERVAKLSDSIATEDPPKAQRLRELCAACNDITWAGQ